ncbi:MAG TPA: phosphotransferase [Methylomirabilota bacterium]|nr:phosphotransferase [Methylomirabilota bacterium]HEV8616817.1 phosphotransferase [Methylomirabilota bacterium]
MAVMESGAIDQAAVREYLEARLGAEVEDVTLRPLGSEDAGHDPKGFGYGVPFEIECRLRGAVRRFVMSRTRPARGFGHDYPADRAWQALSGHAAYNSFPGHVRSLDVGFVRASGELVSAADATDFFQLVEKADGTLYWRDLDRLLHGGALTTVDEARAVALGRFLADAHAEKRDEPALYERRIRELVGHGECVMGILDSYPHPYALLPPETCEALERELVGWRWRLRGRVHRLSRVHGDFHPWNLLFRQGHLSVLDRSRGEWGEPADDVAALAVNYLFFGMRRAEPGGERGVAEPFRGLFHRFLHAYLSASGDVEVLEVLPPFFAFRLLVLAHPRWYPTLSDGLRAELLQLARCMTAATRFDPEDVSWLCGVAR